MLAAALQELVPGMSRAVAFLAALAIAGVCVVVRPHCRPRSAADRSQEGNGWSIPAMTAMLSKRAGRCWRRDLTARASSFSGCRATRRACSMTTKRHCEQPKPRLELGSAENDQRARAPVPATGSLRRSLFGVCGLVVAST
jgi:hypothetical protein